MQPQGEEIIILQKGLVGLAVRCWATFTAVFGAAAALAAAGAPLGPQRVDGNAAHEVKHAVEERLDVISYHRLK